ncbi:hypothetical protein BKA61DRAFT_621270 [Leptodontidium sp. MPI-SDFR-AT-0119]|nr:hypothetical protein BKA61DRAFT_621270 [Leptodontidium sp. MPI-SDFR-AT-0119]
MSSITIHLSAIADTPSRIIYTLSPSTLRNIGPDLDAALRRLTHRLLQTYAAKGREMKHIVTTYTFSTIAIIIDAVGSERSIDTQLVRLRFMGHEVKGYVQDHKTVIEAANAQLQRVRDLHPDMSLPFHCYGGWQGHGSKDIPLYERMVEASKSPKQWQQFKDSMLRPHTVDLPQQGSSHPGQGVEEPEEKQQKEKSVENDEW